MSVIVHTKDSKINRLGTKLVTKELQALIDQVAKSRGTLIVDKGTYLVSSLFLKSNMKFVLEEGAVLLATTNEDEYPILPTRVAGIEMDWYVGVLNASHCSNVRIEGDGEINGCGPYWWNKYWGTDFKSGMREIYDAKDLRWVVDYDCKRIRNLVVDNSHNISIKGIKSKESGFWNIHVLYSDNIHIDDIKIEDSGYESPSTDGIDIDSSSNVLVENCTTSCHDDSICIKSGRDGDGHRVARPCHDVMIRNCTIKDGMGMTIGSEVSGGVYNIKFENIKFVGTDCGFRIKSSIARKGYIKDIEVNNIEMINVRYPFNFALNWNPQYSICKLPTSYKGIVPAHWEALLMQVPSAEENTKVSDIIIKNVTSRNTDDYVGESRAFQIEGFEEQPITNICFENISIDAKEFGIISYVKDIKLLNTKVSISQKNKVANDIFDHR